MEIKYTEKSINIVTEKCRAQLYHSIILRNKTFEVKFKKNID